MATVAPDWHWYQTFLAVIQAGSLSGAARTLGLTQPTVGRQMAALEASLAVKLFTRSLEGLAPTEAALRLLDSAEAMAGAAQMAQRAASGEAEAAVGIVRITASEMIGAEVLPPILAQFHLRYRQIKLELSLNNRNEDLLRGAADVAVRMIRPTQEALIAKRIGRMDVGLDAHRRYLKARGMPRRLADLPEHALIGPDRDPDFVRALSRLDPPLTRDLFSLRSDSHLTQLAALRAGFGIGVCQLGIARRDKNLLPVLRAEVMFPLEVWLVMSQDARTSRRVRLVFDHLAEHLSAYVRGSVRLR
jgi:DNA-binding transcriptional LysR family regulator